LADDHEIHMTKAVDLLLERGRSASFENQISEDFMAPAIAAWL
jgi:hypothetical protein